MVAVGCVDAIKGRTGTYGNIASDFKVIKRIVRENMRDEKIHRARNEKKLCTSARSYEESNSPFGPKPSGKGSHTLIVGQYTSCDTAPQ